MTVGRSWQFSHAILRRPSDSVRDGISSGGLHPDPEIVEQEQRSYHTALQEAGVACQLLDPLEEFPDSIFVEDTAICPAGQAILLRPGAPTRFGEAEAIKKTLERAFSVVHVLDRGFADGGDILLTDEEAFIGLSERTDMEAAAALEPILETIGYTTRIVHTPRGVLHFKSDCALLDSETILATPTLASSGCFKGYEVIAVPEGEEAAANCIRVNDVVIMREGFPKTRDLLAGLGYDLVLISADEIAKLDGGLSCMSLRYSTADGVD